MRPEWGNTGFHCQNVLTTLDMKEVQQVKALRASFNDEEGDANAWVAHLEKLRDFPNNFNTVVGCSHK